MSDLHDPHHPREENPRVDHEETDVNVRALFWFLASFVVVMIFIFGIAKVIFEAFKTVEARKGIAPLTRVVTPDERTPPEPRLQDNPARDMTIFRNAEEKLLHSTQVIDRTTGQIRIPIDRAIVLTARRGTEAAQQTELTRFDRGAITPGTRNPMPADRGPVTGDELPKLKGDEASGGASPSERPRTPERRNQ